MIKGKPDDICKVSFSFVKSRFLLSLSVLSELNEFHKKSAGFANIDQVKPLNLVLAF